MPQLSRILALVITPFSVGLGQWTLGSPFADFSAGGLLERSGGAISVQQRVYSPAANGFRALATFNYDRRMTLDGPLNLASSTGSVAYRRGATGGWLGVRAERGLTSSLRVGGWRQLADWLNVSISSSLRRRSMGGRPSREWTQTRAAGSIGSGTASAPILGKRAASSAGSRPKRALAAESVAWRSMARSDGVHLWIRFGRHRGFEAPRRSRSRATWP